MDMDSEESNILVSEQVEVSDDEGREIHTSVEELLISCVMVRPPLWDSRLPIKQRGKTVRDNLWLEIYEEFGSNPDFPVEFLIKKWRNLRDTYVRLKGDYTPSGSAAKKKKKWEFFDSMCFLNETINFRPTITNLTCPGTSTTPSPLMSPTESNEGEARFDNTPKRSKSVETPIPKLEGAILDALSKINAPTVAASPQINPICLRISEILSQMPQNARTLLEIKLLQVAYEDAKDFL